MKILIVAATEMEIHPLIQFISSPEFVAKDKTIPDVLITGVGMMATTYAVTRQLLKHHYDVAIQVGVCGSFDTKIPLGSVVNVYSDRMGDTGVEDHNDFIDIFDLGLLIPNQTPFTVTELLAPHSRFDMYLPLPKVTGITVNTVSGSQKTIEQRYKRYQCQVESMEGAAFHYSCLQQGVSFAQIRAVSNYVTPRDKSTWKMREAVTALNKWMIDFLMSWFERFSGQLNKNSPEDAK